MMEKQPSIIQSVMLARKLSRTDAGNKEANQPLFDNFLALFRSLTNLAYFAVSALRDLRLA